MNGINHPDFHIWGVYYWAYHFRSDLIQDFPRKLPGGGGARHQGASWWVKKWVKVKMEGHKNQDLSIAFRML